MDSVVGAVVTVGMVVGVVAGLELRQPQPAMAERVRTSTVIRIIAFFIFVTSIGIGFQI